MTFFEELEEFMEQWETFSDFSVSSTWNSDKPRQRVITIVLEGIE